MSIIVSVNEKNFAIKTEKKAKPVKNSFRQQIAGSLKYENYSQAEHKAIAGDMVILVGRKNRDDEKIKAVPVPFITDKEHTMYYWREREDSGIRVSMPKNIQQLFQFTGPIRIYTNDGLMMKIDAGSDDQVAVYRTENLLFIRTGVSGNKIVKERRSKQLAQMGVWKA